ncbi:trifunctional histidinol dehydrogenase, partial [Linderina macrospora]
MLVPKITSGLSESLSRAISYLPTVLYADTQQGLENTKGYASVMAPATSETIVDVLNGGVATAIIASTEQVPADIDASRIALQFAPGELPQESDIERASMLIVTLSSEQIEQGGLAVIAAVAERQAVRVLVESTGKWTEAQMATVQRAGASAVVPAEQLEGPAGVATAFVASSGIQSDRSDGLLTTVVVDEQRVCLGVVFSNVVSIAAAFEAGAGVYWSRKRGLWHKGASSGATQTLVSVSVDCDADALCFTVQQSGAGFCHRNTRTCFGAASGLSQLAAVVEERKQNAPEGSYTSRLFAEPALLRAKLLEEAAELAAAENADDVAFEAADLLYFAMVKCAAHGVSLADVERSLDAKHRKVVRRPGNAKAQWTKAASTAAPAAPEPVVRTSILSTDIRPAAPGERIRMRVYDASELTTAEYDALQQRPIIDSEEIMGRVRPIVDAVRANGDASVLEFTEKFDRVKMSDVVIRAPFAVPELPAKVRAAIDQAYENVRTFHAAQLGSDTCVETMPGIKCSRFSRAIERVGLYVPGGSAVLPSSALMLGVPAQVAGCREIVLATPPRADGTI